MGMMTAMSKALSRFVRGLLSRPGLSQPLMVGHHPRIEGNLVPDDVAALIIRADYGYLQPRVDLMNESRARDGHLECVLSTFELSLMSMEVQVEPASERRRDIKIAAFVEDIYRNFGGRITEDATSNEIGLPELIKHLASGFVHGHAVSETVWDKDTDGSVVPVSAVPIAARRFAVSQTDQTLRFWDSAGSGMFPGIQLARTFPHHYLEFTPQVMGTGLGRDGLWQPLVWAALFRNWSLRDWLQLGQRAWKPWIIARYSEQGWTQREELEPIYSWVAKLIADGLVVLPKGIEFDVQWPSAVGSTKETGHKALMDLMAQEMSKIVLGQTLTTDQGNVGTQALGNVHGAVKRDRRDAFARAIALCLRRMVAPAVRWKFGANATVPRVHLVGMDDFDVLNTAKAVEILAKAGMQIPASWIRRIFRMPPAKIGDEVLGPVAMALASDPANAPTIIPPNVDAALRHLAAIYPERTRVRALPGPGRREAA